MLIRLWESGPDGLYDQDDSQTRFGFDELTRRHGDYAMVGLAAAAQANGAKLRDVRLVFFSVQ